MSELRPRRGLGDPVRADLHIGGLVAADLPIEILHAGTQPHPAGCPDSTTPPTMLLLIHVTEMGSEPFAL